MVNRKTVKITYWIVWWMRSDESFAGPYPPFTAAEPSISEYDGACGKFRVEAITGFRQGDQRENEVEVKSHPIERVAIATLLPHPRNYREHPADQLAHLRRSIEEHGLYRNVVIARDGTILAGHGVVEAAKSLGLTEIGVVRLPIEADSTAALKVLTADNEIEHLAEQDDRALSELLKEIGSLDPAELLGTGYDEQMLANLVFVTRPASEIPDNDAAEHWVGMPDYAGPKEEVRLIFNCDSRADRADLLARLGITRVSREQGAVISVTWPERDRNDQVSLRFVGEADE
jgi:hypothetical protein